MKHIDRRASRGATANRNHTRRAGARRVRQARSQRIFDGVVASYIRDISVRTARG
jgi:hypothetical protein